MQTASSAAIKYPDTLDEDDNTPPPLSARGLFAAHSAFTTASLPLSMFSRTASAMLAQISKTSMIKAIPGAGTAMRINAAFLESVHMATKHYPEPPYGLDATDITELSLPFAELRHFIPDSGTRGEPVLVVPAMANNYPSMMREVVRELLERQHDVYIAHWKGAERVPLHKGFFSLDTYVEYLLHFLAHIGDRANIVAVCQAGPASLAATALTYQLGSQYPRPKTLAVIASPMDTRVATSSMNKEARSRSVEWVDRHCLDTVPPPYPGTGRRVYSGIGQLLGLLRTGANVHKYRGQKMFDAIVDGNLDAAEDIKKFYEDNFNPRMSTDRPFALQTFLRVFKEHHLPQKKWTWNDTIIDPAAIDDTALLAIEGLKDDICPLGQTLAMLAWCPRLDSSKKHHLSCDAGHYSVFAGKEWKTSGAPTVSAFIRQQAGHAAKNIKPYPIAAPT